MLILFLGLNQKYIHIFNFDIFNCIKMGLNPGGPCFEHESQNPQKMLPGF